MKNGYMRGERPPVPVPAEKLVRNLERRQRLLARISGKETSDIPEIVIKDTLLKFLDKKYKRMGQADVADLNRRIFMLLNRIASLADKKQDTSPITAMYAYPYTGARPIDENSYGEYKDEVKTIITLCSKYGIPLKSITGMQHGLGIPKTADLDALITWHESHKEAIDLKSITGMQHGLGIPKTADLDALITWHESHKEAIDLKSITGMQNGLGIPDSIRLEELLIENNLKFIQDHLNRRDR